MWREGECAGTPGRSLPGGPPIVCSHSKSLQLLSSQTVTPAVVPLLLAPSRTTSSFLLLSALISFHQVVRRSATSATQQQQYVGLINFYNKYYKGVNIIKVQF